MDNLADFRRQYPQYNDMSDVELADAIHRKFYSDLPKADIFKKLAVKPTAPVAAPTTAPANAVPMDGVAPAVPATAPVPRNTSVVARLAELDKEERAAQKRLDRITSNTEKYLSSTLGKVVSAPAKLFGAKTTAEEALDIAKVERQETIERINRERDFIAREGRVAPKPTVGQRVTGTLAAIPRGAIEGTSQFLGTLGITGSEGEQSARAMEQRGTRFAENIGLGANEAAEFDPIQRNLESFGSGLGSIIPYVAAELIGRKAAPLTKAAPYVARGAQAILGAGQGATQARQQMDEFEQETGQKIDPTTRKLVQAGGGTIGLTELLPISRMVNGLPAPVRTAVTKRITDIVARTGAGKLAPEAARTAIREVVQGIESRAVGRIATQGILPEALQEGGTQFAQNVLERTAYNPNQELMEGVAENAILGGLVGGTVRGVTEVAQKAVNRGKKQGIDPAAVIAEFQRVAAEETAKVMAANPGMKQNEAVKFVEENAEELFNRATANIVSGTKGGAGDPATASAGVDDVGGSGAGTAVDRESLATETGTTVAGENVDGRLDGSVSSVSVPTTGTGTGVGTLIEPTAKQVKAMVPAIEQAFEASAIDFVDAYESVLGKNNKLNAEQKKQAARIVIQSPEVDPYDAIGSVLDRGLRLRGEKAPSTSRTTFTVTGPPNAQELQDKLTADMAAINTQAAEQKAAIAAPPSLDEQAVAPIRGAIKSVITPTGGAIPTLAQTTARQAGIAPTAPPVEAPPVAAPVATPVRDDTISGAVYGAQNNERNPLTYEDLIDQLDFLETLATEGKLTPERLASSDFGQVQDIGTLTGLKDRIAADPVGTIQRLRESAELNNQRDMAEAAPDVAVQEPVQDEEDLRPARESIKPEVPGAPLRAAPQRAVSSTTAPVAELKPSFLETMTPEERQGFQQSKEMYAELGVTSGTQAGYEVPTYNSRLFMEGMSSVAQGKAIPTRQQLEEAVGPFNADYFDMGVAAAQERIAREEKKKLLKRMKNAPGKTARQKLFAIMEEDQAKDLKNNPEEDTSDLEPQAEEIEGRAGLNKKRLLEAQRAKYRGAPASMTGVVAKELLQNSHDATRTAMEEGLITEGKISFDVSNANRTITIIDNGIGMPGSLLAGEFLELGSTGKGAGTGKNSGGFGLAKALLLYGSDKIDVITANNGKISTLDTSGEALAAAAIDEGPQPRIKVRDFTPEDYQLFPDGHGSIVQLLMPAEELGVYSGVPEKVTQLPDKFGKFNSLLQGVLHSPLFANTEVTYNGEIIPVGSNFPLTEYNVFARAKLPYGVAHIYVSKEKTTYPGNTVYILSDGVWQFTKDITGTDRQSLPYDIYINIIPFDNVKPDSSIYPFNEQRKNFSEGGEEAHAKLAKLLSATYGLESYAESVKSFGNIQYYDPNTQIPGAVIDLTPEMPQDILDKIANIGVADNSDIEIGQDGRVKVNGNEVDTDSIEDLQAAIPKASQLIIDQSKIDANSVMIHENADLEYLDANMDRQTKPLMEVFRDIFGTRIDDFFYLVGDSFQQLRGEVVNIMGPEYAPLADEAIGVSIDPTYRGVSVKVPFSGMFINPLVPVGEGPQSLLNIINTMIHELSHFKVRNHGPDFPAEMQNIDAMLGAAVYNQGFDFVEWKKRFVQRALDAGYLDIISTGQEIFATSDRYGNFKYGNSEYNVLRIKYRGEHFSDNNPESIPERTGSGDRETTVLGGTEAGGSGEEPILGPAYESRKGTGKGRKSEGSTGGGEPLTDANVEKAVSVKLTKAQIKRLEAAAGIRGMEVNKLQKRIIQSRNDNEIKGLVKRLSEAVQNPDANSGIIASLTQSMPPLVYKAVLGFQQIDDVFRLAKLAGMKSIGKIDTIMREEYIPYVNRIVRRASTVEQEWTAFASRDPDGNAALDDSMIYSNMIDADPSLAGTAAEYMRIDPKLKELEASLATEADANKQKSLKGQITRRKDDIKRLYFGGALKDADGNPVLDENKKPVAVLGWNKLPPEGRKIFKAARDFHRANFNEHYRLLMQRIDDAKFDSNDAVKLKSSIEEMFNKARERTIYFPVKRFGDYWLSVGNDFYMRETPAELKALQRRLKKEGETRAMVLGTSREDLRNKVASNDASAALKGILDALDGSNTAKNNGKPRLEKDDIEGLRDLVFQMYLTALPEADMRRRFVHRRFITGFSTDSLRTFAATAVASANQLGRLAYNYKFQNVLEEAKAESESDELTPYRDALRSEIAERVQSVLAPETNNSIVNMINKIIAFGSKVTFYHHLSSAASAMINLTQLHTLGLPVLSGEFGEAKTAAMAARYTTSFLAGREIPNPFRDEDGNIALQAPDFKLQNSAYMRGLKKNDPDRYKQTLAAIEYAQDHDVIESTFASSAQLYERSNAPTGKFNFRQAVRRGEALTAAQRASANAMSAMGFLFHSTETIGRGIMYMSSFDLAYERAISQGKTPEQAGPEARKLAAELTNKAMFDFTNWNKSRFAKAPAGRFALQMTSYIHSLSSLLLRSFVGMIPFFNKEGKAAAARVFFGSAGVTMLYGGIRTPQFYALAMGGYTLIKYVESLFEDDDDEEKDTKEGVLGEKAVEREFLKYADENGNELGKKDMEYYIRATFIPETFGKGSTLATALGLSDKAAANLATAADMGIPGLFGVDISGSVAMGDLPFIWSNVQVKGDTPEVRAYESVAKMALGPAGSVGVSYVKAADAWNKGDIQQAIELVVPAAIRNPLKGQRLQEEGLKIGKDKDIQLKDPSYYTNGKVTLQSLGFKDAETSRNMQLDILAGDVEREVAAQKTELLDRRYRATLKYDADPSPKNELALQQVEYDINVYDENYPSNSMSKDTKRKSFKAKEQDATDKSYGLGVNPKIPIRDVLYEERIQQALEAEGK